jgi:hypothetical protein
MVKYKNKYGEIKNTYCEIQKKFTKCIQKYYFTVQLTQALLCRLTTNTNRILQRV